MKFLIAFAALVAVALAAPANQQDATAVVSRSVDEHNPDGSYTNSVETSNGISQQETGQLVQAVNPETGKPQAVIASRGSYQWTAPDNVQYLVQWVADQNGFQPQAAHLPTPPPAL